MSDTPETDAEHKQFAMGGFTLDFCRKLERERDEAREAFSSIHRWIERNHADGFIDSLTYLQNLERVTDCWYDRIDKIERERDEARELLEAAQNALDAIHLEVGSWITKLKSK